jgi:hypothetical protein
MSMEAVSAKDTPTNGNATALQGERPSATIRYSDRVDVSEIFADSITSLVVDAQLMRIEFGVTRLDEMKANSPLTGRRYPACRIVLSPAAALDLVNRLRHAAAVFSQLAKAAPQSQAQSQAEPMKPDYNASAAIEQGCLGP